MPDRDLKLNNLSRFSKQSSRFVLEEYSHCEVPAGCGGAVLRWRTPGEPLPFLMYHPYFGAHGSLYLDGKKHRLARLEMPFGVHTLALEQQGFNPQFAFLMFAGTFYPQYLEALKVEGDTVIRTLPDGTWRFSMQPPAQGWMLPDFDDSTWTPLVERPIDKTFPTYGQTLEEITAKVREYDAVALGLPDGDYTPMLDEKGKMRPIYIRKTFTIRQGE